VDETVNSRGQEVKVQRHTSPMLDLSRELRGMGITAITVANRGDGDKITGNTVGWGKSMVLPQEWEQAGIIIIMIINNNNVTTISKAS